MKPPHPLTDNIGPGSVVHAVKPKQNHVKKVGEKKNALHKV